MTHGIPEPVACNPLNSSNEVRLIEPFELSNAT